ncbi:MAG TPA: glycogen/starch synthase [Patescibacteria group bacterium]|nr:glycogen/starch synthase [Patescibacteria group bacterium]
MKVLFVSAEVAPFSSVGGLSQVSHFLPRALLKRGVDVRIFTPKYGIINDREFPTKRVIEGLEIPTGEDSNSLHPQKLICNVNTPTKIKRGEPQVYFLENMEYYEKRANVYNYSDDHIRFGLLSRGALEFIKKGEFVPNLIHCNDWHTAYLIDYLKNIYNDEPLFENIAALFSIHNLYQGMFDFEHASEMDFDDGKSRLAPFFTERFYKQNALKRGVIYADVVNTVSETYSREILSEEYGGRLHNLFKELRGKLFGALNGLDYNDFDPRIDRILKKNFGLTTLNERAENKVELQREFNLEVSPQTPILAISGRLDAQKGLELVMDTIEFILNEFDVQFIALGTGDDKYLDFLQKLEKKYPRRVGTHLMKNFALPRKIFAGADVILIPSQYEPGGIVALEAMRYGCIPVVRETGGLADSVKDFDLAAGKGTGFVFKKFFKMSFLTAVVRALETYKNQKIWKKIVRQAMREDFSWDHTASEYLNLYQRAVEVRKETQENISPFRLEKRV